MFSLDARVLTLPISISIGVEGFVKNLAEDRICHALPMDSAAAGWQAGCLLSVPRTRTSRWPECIASHSQQQRSFSQAQDVYVHAEHPSLSPPRDVVADFIGVVVGGGAKPNNDDEN